MVGVPYGDTDGALRGRPIVCVELNWRRLGKQRRACMSLGDSPELGWVGVEGGGGWGSTWRYGAYLWKFNSTESDDRVNWRIVRALEQTLGVGLCVRSRIIEQIGGSSEHSSRRSDSNCSDYSLVTRI